MEDLFLVEFDGPLAKLVNALDSRSSSLIRFLGSSPRWVTEKRCRIGVKAATAPLKGAARDRVRVRVPYPAHK